jgi:hypothetical protein
MAEPLAAQPQDSVPAAVLIEGGGVAGSQVVGLGRDVVIQGRAAAGVVALSGSVEIGGEVEGDVVVVDGDVSLGREARVQGDVFVLGGDIGAASGAVVTGRSVAYPAASGALMVLAEGPALGLSPWSKVVVSGKLALLAAWLVTAALLVAVAGPAVTSTAEAIGAEPLRCFAVGAVGVVAMLLSGLFFGATLDVLVGVPMVLLLVVAALVLKLWGLVAVFAWLGRALLRRPTPALSSVLAGIAALGVVKLLPWVGTWVWTAATLIGVGATLLTKFGRREEWFAGG